MGDTQHTSPRYAITKFGDPLLRSAAKRLTTTEVTTAATQQLMTALRTVLQATNGVGMAAPQLGEPVALAVVAIHPTKLHPEAEVFTAVLINPAYEGVGRRVGMWEGCLSAGEGDDILYGKARRYERINATWLDEAGQKHQEQLTGFIAHVFQHETDHLNGVLFVDHVRDNRTLMLAGEFMRHVLPSLPKQ